MKVKELENILKELKQPEISETLKTSILDYSKSRCLSESKEIENQNSILTIIINRVMLKIAGLIPFFEVLWFMNEKFIKKNNIKIKLNF
ncbi:MAG TPA: hypothetical protein PLK90_03855 [Clostridiales bacterium]|jgi:hypothetical protein|nr:hypothetical protein [Clostridiales bacterium]HQP69515.1 hypothetical protein [Clostridiales bacterium]